LAAGFDKNGVAWRGAAALGFGHVEIGTVTLLRQPGNDRPRVFRYPAQEAVINRMGFNNQGAEAVARRLARLAPPGTRRIPLGINLGKSRAAPLDKACAGLSRQLPNAGRPRRLPRDQRQQPEHAGSAQAAGGTLAAGAARRLGGGNRARVAAGRPRRPLLLKIAPDLTFPRSTRCSP
jgi:dihydroorotate dehydrogenase